MSKLKSSKRNYKIVSILLVFIISINVFAAELDKFIDCTRSETIESYIDENSKNENLFNNTEYIKLLQTFLNNGADINTLDEFGRNSLMRLLNERQFIWSNYNFEPTIKFLLEKGIFIDHQDRDGKSALFYAEDGYIPLLIQFGSDTTIKDNMGNTALNRSQVVGYKHNRNIIKFSQSINIPDNNGKTPVMKLFAENSFTKDASSILRTLAEKGADLRKKDVNGYNVMHYAAYAGDKNSVLFLIKQGVKCDVKSKKDKNTPLLLATERGQTEIAKLLFENGANPKKKNRAGLSAQISAYAHNNRELINLFSEPKLKFNLKRKKPFELSPVNDLNISPARYTHYRSFSEYLLFTACRYGNFVLLNYLNDNGVDINQIGMYGETPLLAASNNNQYTVVKYLLEEGASAKNSEDSTYENIFWLVSENNNKNINDPLNKLLYENTDNRILNNTEYAILKYVYPINFEDIDFYKKHYPDLYNYFNIVYATYKFHKDYKSGFNYLLKQKVPFDLILRYYIDDNEYFRGNIKFSNDFIKIMLKSGENRLSIDSLYKFIKSVPREKQIKYFDDIVRQAITNYDDNLIMQIKGSYNYLIDLENYNLIEYISKKSKNINRFETVYRTPSNKKYTPLMYAAVFSDTKMIKLLLKCGVSLEIRGDFGRTVLHEAVGKKNNTENVKLLLDQKIDVDVKDNYGVTPLMIAAENGNNEIIKILLKYGADVNKVDNDGWSALLWACYKGQNGTAKFLLNNGSDVNIVTDNGFSPIIMSKIFNNYRLTELLYNFNAKEISDNNEKLMEFQLLKAAETGNYEKTIELINIGVNKNCYDSRMRTPIFLAAKNGHYKTVKILLKAGCDPNLSDKNNVSPLMAVVNNETAFRYGNNVNYIGIIKLLIRYNADINHQDKYGNSAIHYASEIYNVEENIVKLLINEDANPGLKNKNGNTIIHLAAFNEKRIYSEDWKKILKKIKNLDDLNNRGVTPLMIASISDSTEFLKILLDNSADPNVKDRNGFKAIDYAMSVNNINAVKILEKVTSDVSDKVYLILGNEEKYYYRYKSALKYYETGLDKKNNPDLFYGAGISSLMNNDYRNAYHYFLKGLELAPSNSDLLYGIGYYYTKINNQQKAVEYLYQAVLNDYHYPYRILYHEDFELLRKSEKFKKVQKLIEKYNP